MSYSDGDGNESWDTLAELPGPGAAGAMERNIRRRSSKACDQCRKSKCKCEFANPNEPCKNCSVLGTLCTFLGPSRKRGPPKGYIDAIEAKLHQTEALLGIMLSTTDRRAQTFLRDISKDPLAKEIINRVDNSPYGVKGRSKGDVVLNTNKAELVHSSESRSSQELSDSVLLDLRSTHPSNEWQDRVIAMINDLGASSLQRVSRQDYSSPKSEVSDDGMSSSSRRQRRRVGSSNYQLDIRDKLKVAPGSPASAPLYERHSGHDSRWYPTPSPAWGDFGTNSGSGGSNIKRERRSSSVDSKVLDSDSEEELLSAVGQLSLNEDQQVRYHGKASGIYLLRNKERVDQRNEGDIWRFPKARVWPLLPTTGSLNEGDGDVELPPKGVQEHLLGLYFTYVHPFLPIIHKQSFIEAFKEGHSPISPLNQATDSTNPNSNLRRRVIPSLLLLSMFACAARHDSKTTPFPSDPSIMWPAGDEFLERAKVLLNSTYASARPSTVQALLLMGYREAGIGDMSLAWTYVGMGIRMAQDLGMHRLADGWKRGGLGGRLFGEWELAERKRIWFGCVVLDKFISAVIGRPIMVLECDFDTLLPSIDDLEENEEWSVEKPLGERSSPAPGRIMSCFNATAVLFDIFGRVIQSLYAIRPARSLVTDAAILESTLDKWFLDLPDHLQCDLVSNGSSLSVSSSSKQSKKPLPNVLALHMHYWTAVLILHRPFIARLLHRKEKPNEDEDTETRTRISKNYEMCRTAAIHVATLVSIYQETYLFERCSPLLIYCLFSATILLDADVLKHPDDPQARLSFSKCMKGLDDMGIVWPTAGRALTLFTGAKSETTDANMVELTWSSTARERNKRPAEQELEDSFSKVSDITSLQLPPASQAGQIPTHFDFVPPRPQSVPNIGNSQPQLPQRSLFNRPIEDVYNGGRAYIPLPLVPLASAGHAAASSVENSSYLNAYPELSTTVLPQLYSSGLIDDLEGSLPNTQSLTDLYQQPQGYQPYSAGNLVPPYLYQPNMLQRMTHYELQDTALEGTHQRPRHDQQLRVGQQPHARVQQTRHQQQVYLPQNYNVYM